MRVRVFIDFWNFQLMWNEWGGGARCDWTMLPTALVNAASGAIGPAGLGALTLEETRVYAGYEAGRESQLGNWLHNFLDRQPGVRVFTSERHWRKQPVYCPNCRTEHETCVVCGADFGRAAEKTIDARIVTDLVGLAWEDAYDVAILVSADKDFIPAVEHVQAKNFKVINATWRKRGHQLAKVAWASFYLDDVAARIARA